MHRPSRIRSVVGSSSRSLPAEIRCSGSRPATAWWSSACRTIQRSEREARRSVRGRHRTTRVAVRSARRRLVGRVGPHSWLRAAHVLSQRDLQSLPVPGARRNGAAPDRVARLERRGKARGLHPALRGDSRDRAAHRGAGCDPNLRQLRLTAQIRRAARASASCRAQLCSSNAMAICEASSAGPAVAESRCVASRSAQPSFSAAARYNAGSDPVDSSGGAPSVTRARDDAWGTSLLGAPGSAIPCVSARRGP